tara:strand:- start:666 stop:1283 length:618 start_codon:yes stop_codon:yes gene_type:complete
MKALDLFCGGGGSSMGLSKFFDVTGIDINPQPEYPFKFIQKDVFTLSDSFLQEFDFIWASPTCQIHTWATNKNTKKKYTNQIPATRTMLEKSGVPYCIENVETAPLRKDLKLCGEMFGLRVIRHRIFECNGFKPIQPKHIKHRKRIDKKHSYYSCVAGHGGDGYSSKISDWQKDIGCDWINDRHTLAQIVPPKYTEYIIKQYLRD